MYIYEGFGAVGGGSPRDAVAVAAPTSGAACPNGIPTGQTFAWSGGRFRL